MGAGSAELTFDFLDDLALAVDRRRVDPQSHLRPRKVESIGPFLELFVLDRAKVLPIDALPICDIRRTFSAALNNSVQGSHLISNNIKIGFTLTSRNPHSENQVNWIAFCRKAQEAAELSLPKQVAQGLIGAMREVEENVHLHSERAYDGIVGFRGTPNEFEFVVIDSGIGILNSLKKSPDYQHLADSGSAIKTALTDGNSCLNHSNQGHGYGFHDLFVGLANLNGELRFRSGDHALTIDGTSPSLMTSRLGQKVNIPGFLVSIICRIKSAPVFH